MHGLRQSFWVLVKHLPSQVIELLESLRQIDVDLAQRRPKICLLPSIDHHIRRPVTERKSDCAFSRAARVRFLHQILKFERLIKIVGETITEQAKLPTREQLTFVDVSR